MSERVEPGHYRVGRRDVAEETTGKARNAFEKRYGVIKGETINETTHGPWGRVYGVSDSKWYAYVGYSLSVRKRMGDGTLATTGTDSHSVVDMYDEEFDTKGAAEDYLDRMCRFDERF